MKRLNIFLMAILMTLAISKASFATNYYIDCAGSNSNDGLTTLTPWADFSPQATTGFLHAGDILNVKTDCTFSGSASASQAYLYSAGNPANHIVIQTYGGGADPIFDASVDVASVPGWTGWTVSDAVNGVYVSNVTIPWAVNSVLIDGTSSLKKRHPTTQSLATLSTNAGIAMFHQPSCTTAQSPCAANQLLYLRLADSSDPNGHTIRFSRYGNSDTDGHTRGQFGVHDSTEQYVDIHHIQIVGSNTQGFSSGAPFVNFYNCTSFGSAREGWYIVKNATQNATGAAYNTINNSTATYSNSNLGQQITIESSHVDLIDTTSAYGWMAGIDWLDYNSSTDASDGRCIRCISHDNGRRAINKDPNGFDPMGVYIDGGHNIQLIDSVFYGSDAGFYPTSTAANAIYLVSVQSEHPSTKPVYNVDIVNSLLYNSNYCGLQSGALNCSGSACQVVSNIRVISSTIYAGAGDKSICFGQLNPTGLGVYLYNNVIERPGGGTPLNSYTSQFHSDYNSWLGNASGITATMTLADVKSTYGQDMHSINTSSLRTGSGLINGISQAYHLSSIAAGQGSNSPALNLGLPWSTWLGTQYVYSNYGTVRSDGVADSTVTPSAGYHYLTTFVSSTFPSTQVGTDYL